MEDQEIRQYLDDAVRKGASADQVRQLYSRLKTMPAPQPKTQPKESAVGDLIKAGAETYKLGKAAKDMPIDYLTDVGNMAMGKKPVITDSKLETVGNIAEMGLPFLPEGALAGMAGRAVKAIKPAGKAIKAAPVDLTPVMRAISKTYDEVVKKANTLYDFTKQLAQGKYVKIPELKAHLADIIKDVENAPYHEAKTSVGKLQEIHDSLDDSGLVSVNSLIDLRKFTNESFNPNRITNKSSTYGKVNSFVNQGLDVAKEQLPNFKAALDLADKHWVNHVEQPFNDNKVLQSLWKPEDAHAFRALEKGRIDELPDATKKRVDNLVKNIKDRNDYNAVRRALPKDQGTALDAAILQQMPTGRAKAAGKMVFHGVRGELPSALRAGADVLNPDLKAEQKGLLDAIKQQNTFTPLADKTSKTMSEFEKLKQQSSQPTPIAGLLPPPSINVPMGGFKAPDPKMLPAPGKLDYLTNGINEQPR